MLTISKKVLWLWFTILSVGLILIPIARLDAYLTIYCIIMFFFASWCVLSIKNRVINTLMIFSLFYAILLGFGPMILYYENFSYYVETGLYIILAYLCFVIGYHFSGRISFKRKIRSMLCPEKYNSQSIMLISIILYCIGISAYILYFAKNWNTIYGSNLENGRVVAMTGNGLLLWLGRLAWLAVYMIYEQRIIHDKYKKITNTVIVIASIFSILMGFRSALVDAVLILFFMKNKKEEIPIRKMLIIAVALFVFVGLYGMLRSGRGTVVDSLINEFKVSSVNLNYILSNFPNKVSYQMGATYLMDIQALFDDNVDGVTQWLKEVLKLNFSGGGVTPTIIGEFYFNWGNIGVVSGMLLVGLIIKKIDQAYRNQNNSIFLSCIFLGYIRSIIRGGIGNCTMILLIYITGYYCCCFIANRIKI